MTKEIAYLPGDGVGPEVALAARQVLEKVAPQHGLELKFTEVKFGGAAIDATGNPFPEETKEVCLRADALLLGAVGGPKWDQGGPRPEQGLLELRKSLGVFANLRPIAVLPNMEHLSPLAGDRANGVDMVIVRELTGGVYFGKREEGDELAKDELAYSREEVERVARIAFEAAKKRKGRVTSVDKANVLATSRLWRKAVVALQEREYPEIELDHVLVDAMAMKLIQNPSAFDVVVTENMFGDILSDEASVITGSIGLAPSASLGASTAGLYEPIHGSAPDIAGQDKANPAGTILSAAMLLRYSLGAEEAAKQVEDAVIKAVQDGHKTTDIGGDLSCTAFTQKVLEYLD